MNKQITVILIMLLFIALVVVFGFKFSQSVQITQWRLARIAMVHANLMAGETEQDEIGTVDPERLEALNSFGYGVTYGVFDPETGGFIVKKTDPGIQDLFDWEAVFSESAGLTKDVYGIPSDFGYVLKTDIETDVVPWDFVTYSLPVVYRSGEELKYGLLFVALHPTMNIEQRDNIISSTKLLAERLEAVKNG
jgi:hypothetical protein